VNRTAKRFAAIKVVGLVCVFLVAAAPRLFSQSTDPAAEALKLMPGAYYWTGMNWQALEPLEWSANGIKRIGKISVWIYRHPQARVQLKEATPLFCYRLPEASPGSPTEQSLQGLMIARLDQKKDRRELQITSGTAAFAFRTGSIRGRMDTTSVTSITPDLFLIAPKQPLAPGEYVIGDSSLTLTGYDFGIHSAK
jgi:hypothetical protein